jgi:hypothetical protein
LLLVSITIKPNENILSDQNLTVGVRTKVTDNSITQKNAVMWNWTQNLNYVTPVIGPGFGYESESNHFATIRLAYYFWKLGPDPHPDFFTLYSLCKFMLLSPYALINDNQYIGFIF